MRPSKQKTTVAVLRLFLDRELKVAGEGGMNQKEFSDVINTPITTLQHLEQGRLALSASKAKRISEATGVSFGWLLERDTSRPIEAVPCMGLLPERELGDGEPVGREVGMEAYTLDHYKRARWRIASIATGLVKDESSGWAKLAYDGAVSDLCTRLRQRFCESPDGAFQMWSLLQALLRVSREFPPSEEDGPDFLGVNLNEKLVMATRANFGDYLLAAAQEEGPTEIVERPEGNDHPPT